MKIVFFGDSITDAGKRYDYMEYSYGHGFLGFIAGQLHSENPEKYQIVNSGISGNRVVDLYARIQADVWNHGSDVVSILIGVNDLWHKINHNNGVDVDRYEKVYRAILTETLEKFPNVRFILCEPFVLEGDATINKMDEFKAIKEYANVVKKLAKEFGAQFLPLQEVLEKKATQYPAKYWLWDGVHPTRGGAKVIADEWLKLFKEKIDKE